ncbi:MAG: hypothetical protein B6U75_01820 [Desulfurococcales archaeon ex4484_217_1]|nr:MAG: hypothetical protein B6U75_01820 [Desulfurococcales archaeon ex4484_217_1]
MSKKLKELKKYCQQRKPDVRIGKAGISEGILREIDRRLKEQGIVKVKILKAAFDVEKKDRFQIAKEAAEKLGALLVEVRGKTFTIYRSEKALKKKLKTSM